MFRQDKADLVDGTTRKTVQEEVQGTEEEDLNGGESRLEAVKYRVRRRPALKYITGPHKIRVFERLSKQPSSIDLFLAPNFPSSYNVCRSRKARGPPRDPFLRRGVSVSYRLWRRQSFGTMNTTLWSVFPRSD